MTVRTFRDRESGQAVEAMRCTAEATMAVLAWIPADRQYLTDLAGTPAMYVYTPSGRERVWLEDWVVRGPRGGFWPMNGAAFAEQYEPMPDRDLIKPAAEEAPADPDYWVAGRDDRGDIRLRRGQGLLVARATDTRGDIHGWLDRCDNSGFRRQYLTALTLLDAEEANHA